MIAALAGSVFVFWFLTGLIVFAMFAAVENDNGIIATITLLATAVVAYFIYDFNVISWTIANLNTVLYWIVGYFVVAVIWARAKWALFLRAMLREMKKQDYKFGDGRFYFRGELQKVPARANENKKSIVIWMTYWPVSMTWTLINDPVRRAFNAIYDAVANSFQKDSDKVFKDYVKKKDNES